MYLILFEIEVMMFYFMCNVLSYYLFIYLLVFMVMWSKGIVFYEWIG